ncbi:hypothetical protein GIB67_034191, partial [Kingdonia uniflora]
MLTNFQRMRNIDLFGPTALRAGITLVVVTSVSVHSLSQDFSLSDEAKGLDLGWHMEWTGRCERLPIARLRDPPPMSSSYGAEELWHLTHGIRRLVLTESARDAQRLQEVVDELAIARRQIDSIDHQLYAHISILFMYLLRYFFLISYLFCQNIYKVSLSRSGPIAEEGA